MSKRFRYTNGFISTVSDKVAVILEKKGQGRPIGEAKQEEKPVKEKAEK